MYFTLSQQSAKARTIAVYLEPSHVRGVDELCATSPNLADAHKSEEIDVGRSNARFIKVDNNTEGLQSHVRRSFTASAHMFHLG